MFACVVYVCTFQLGNVMGWGREGANNIIIIHCCSKDFCLFHSRLGVKLKCVLTVQVSEWTEGKEKNVRVLLFQRFLCFIPDWALG